MKDSYPALRYSALVLVITSLTGCINDPSSTPDTIDQTAESVMQRYDVPGLALAKIEEGHIEWIGTYGAADSERPVDRDTIFNVASLTKPLFALGYLHSVEAGETDLDEPLANHWVDPDVADAPELPELTARLALSHQSGFPNWRGNSDLYFMFTPGQRHEYSGEGYEYVRRALQQQTGEPMPVMMQQQVLTSADMEHTNVGWQPELADKIAAGYDEAGKDIGLDFSERQPNAAANTFTTIEDYSRFAAWVARGAELDPALYQQMTQPQATHPNPLELWGLGWRLTQMDDRTLIEHDGREPGIRTQVMIDPVDQRGLVMLTNSSNGELIVRTLVQATWPDADAVLAQRDADIWHYLTAFPEPALPGMLGFIAESPSFSMKLLYAAKAGLIDDSGLSAGELQQADETIDALVYRQFKDEVNASQMRDLFMQLGEPTNQGFRFATALNAEQSRQWLAAVADTAELR